MPMPNFFILQQHYLQKEKKYIYTVHYPTYPTYKNIQYTTLKHYKSCTICSYLRVLYILSFFFPQGWKASSNKSITML